MTTPELPPLPKMQPVLMDDMELGIIPDEFKEYRAAAESRERALVARIAELEAALDAVIIRTDCTSWGMGYDIWKIASAARKA